MDLAISLRSIVASTLALVLWGMVFWGLLSPALGAFRDAPVQAASAQVLADADTPTGTYFFPWPRSDPGWSEAHTRGPFFKLSYVREGAAPDSAGKLALGTAHNLLVVVLAHVLLALALPAAASFGRRFAIVLVAGTMGSVLIQVGDPIWFHLPWDYAGASLVYELGSWAVVGATAGALYRPRVRQV